MHVPSRIALAALFTVVTTTSLPAQARPTIEWGIMAGPSLSNMKGDEANPELKNHTGVMAGVSLVLSGAKAMALEVDALYVAKGFKSVGSTGHFALDAGFLEVPVLWRIQRPISSGRVQPFVVVGPAFGVRMSCGLDSKFNGASSNVSCDEFTTTTKEEVASMAMSGVVGGGVMLPVGNVHLTAGARFTRSFTSVLKDADNHFEGIGLYLGVSRGRRR